MRKKIVLTIMFFLIGSAAALAGPFLVCSPVPSDTVSHYCIQIDGLDAVIVPAFGNPDGTVMLHYDLKDLANGNHNFEIAAANVWGESVYVPFDFKKGVPGGPQNFGLSPD